MNNQPIGLMDSGVGGLTVYKQVYNLLPNESYVFVGDQANLPYGEKSPKEVLNLTKRITEWLIKNKNIKMLVIACNTATAAALPKIKSMFEIPIIGVIEPGSYMAATQTKNNKIGIIATDGTVKSGKYNELISEFNNEAQIYSLGCPRFVPMIEDGLAHTPQMKKVVDEDLAFFDNTEIDTLVLGCTHYPIIQELIQDRLKKVVLINPGIATANTVNEYLVNHHLLSDQVIGNSEFISTGDTEQFTQTANELLNRKDIKAQHIDI